MTLVDFRVLRAQRIAERALDAYRDGANNDQLSDFIEEIIGVLKLDLDVEVVVARTTTGKELADAGIKAEEGYDLSQLLEKGGGEGERDPTREGAEAAPQVDREP